MLVSELLNHIISNFDLQVKLYDKMSGLAQLQLELLRGEDYEAIIDQVNEILMARKQVITEIEPLNRENREYQQEIAAQLNISRFTIKGIKDKVPAGQMQNLQEVVARVETMLAKINATDCESENIMRAKGQDKPAIKPAASPQKAASAYNQAKRQMKKP